MLISKALGYGPYVTVKLSPTARRRGSVFGDISSYACLLICKTIIFESLDVESLCLVWVISSRDTSQVRV